MHSCSSLLAKSDLCRVATSQSCDKNWKLSYHPDFSSVGNPAMLLKHPLVVGEQQFQAEAQCQDEGEPQQSAKDQCREHGLTLGTERDVKAA